MSSSHLLVPHVFRKITSEIKNDTWVLDCACGRGKWGSLIRINYPHGINIIGCDIFLPYLDFCRVHKMYDALVCCDVAELPFRAKIFGVSIGCEILEHLSKTKGRKFIEEMRRVTKAIIVISTPNVYRPQEAIHGNIYEVHRTLWSPKDLRELGFKVRGVGVRVTGSQKLPKMLRFFLKLIMPLDRLSYVFPSLSQFLVAWREP